MENNLISGYMAYTTAEEYGAALKVVPPGTLPTTPACVISAIIGTTVISSGVTLGTHC